MGDVSAGASAMRDAPAWFAHGIWDLAHLRADAGVARTGVEWCAVVDVLIAAQLVVLPLAL